LGSQLKNQVHLQHDLGDVPCYVRGVPWPTAALLSFATAGWCALCGAATLLRYSGPPSGPTGRPFALTAGCLLGPLWALFFLLVFCEVGVDAARHVLPAVEADLRAQLALAALLVHGLAAFLLGLDLQRRHSRPPPSAVTMPDEGPPLLLLTLLLTLALYELAVCLAAATSRPWAPKALAYAAALQSLPVAAVLAAIVCDGPRTAPPGATKGLLLAAIVLQWPTALPEGFWNRVAFPGPSRPCLGPYSRYDLLLLLRLGALVLLFLFIRLEYLRRETQVEPYHRPDRARVHFLLY